MASDRRSSLSSIRSAISRTSMGSNRPGTPTERRPSSPLTQPSAGVPTLSPPPSVGKSGLPPPMTPQRKPVQRQKSPLSAEAFSSPASMMPGSFPAETPALGQSQEATPTSDSRSSKRLSSMSKFLPFKALRRSYDATSPQSPSSSPNIDTYRPKTPGGESMISSSSPKPSLRKRVSGTFFRRKSSLGMGFAPGDDATSGAQDLASIGSPTSPRTNGFDGGDHSPIRESSRPSSPTLADNSPIMKKRKSGTFWRRTSSLTLTQTLNAERQGWNRKVSEGNYANARRSEDVLRERIVQDRAPKIEMQGVPNAPVDDDENGRNATASSNELADIEKTERGGVENVGEKTRGVGVGGGSLNRKTSNTQTNGGGMIGRIGTGLLDRKISNSTQPQQQMRRTSDHKPLPPKPRTPSPPPQLPEFVGAGGGLGLDEWLEGF